jgi:hypothetical protein
MKIECECGFKGSVRPFDGVGKCPGCDTIYIANHEGEVHAMATTEMPTFDSYEELRRIHYRRWGTLRVEKRKHLARRVRSSEVGVTISLPNLTPVTVYLVKNRQCQFIRRYIFICGPEIVGIRYSKMDGKKRNLRAQES